MDNLIQTTTQARAPLILPRRSSIHSDYRAARRFPSAKHALDSESLEEWPERPIGRNKFTHLYYYPSSDISSRPQPPNLNSNGEYQPIFSYGNERGKDGFISGSVTSAGPLMEQISMGSRRHSVSSSSPWSSLPPPHALHMPVMKVLPEIWRLEHFQKEIHRNQEGRRSAVMKRRDIQNVMDTAEDGDDEDNEMSGVECTIDLGAFKAMEQREKDRIRDEVRREWARLVQEQTDLARYHLAQADPRRHSWPVLRDSSQDGLSEAGVQWPLTLPQPRRWSVDELGSGSPSFSGGRRSSFTAYRK